MEFPDWVHRVIREYEPPQTGLVILHLECYNGGVTKVEIGAILRMKPTIQKSMDKLEQKIIVTIE